MENFDFNTSGSTELKYIPTVEEIDRPEPVNTRNGTEEFRVPPPEINSKQIEMDFSTPISDVMPSAAFDSAEDSAAYVSPTTQRVTGIAPGMIGGPPSTKSGGKNPLGLTDEQFQAAVAGVVAVIAFSKPVQDKLADMVPKFLNEAGNLSPSGMAITALITAIMFYLALNVLKNQK